jgi:hypothetical protein
MYTPEEQEFINTLTPIEQKAMQIAKRELKSSFTILGSNHYQTYTKEKKEKAKATTQAEARALA